MPHPIPDGPELIDGWRYYLVALPDDDTAVSVGWAIYSELINNWAWGLEGIEPDSPTMAQVWAGAVFETLRLADMNILEDIFAAIDEVEGLLQLIAEKETQSGDAMAINDSICCDGVVAPVEDTTGSDIVRDVGDPPGGVIDWPTYDARLCEAALRYANNLTEWVDTMQALSALTTLGLALALAGLVGGLAAVGIAGAAAIGAMGVLEALGFLNKVIGVFTPSPGWGDARSQLNDADTINAIACAIIQSDTPAEAESAVDAALLANAPDAYDIFEPWPLRFTMNKIFNMETDAGGFGGADCPECEEPLTSITWSFDTTEDGWRKWTGATEGTDTGPATWWNAGQPAGCLSMTGTVYHTSPEFNLAACTNFTLEADVSRGSDGAQRTTSWRLIDTSGNVIINFANMLVSTAAWQHYTSGPLTGSWAGGPVRLQALRSETTGINCDNPELTVS